MRSDYITRDDTVEEIEAKVRFAEGLKYQTTYQGRIFWHKLRSSDLCRLFGVGGNSGGGPIPPSYSGARMVGDTLVVIRHQSVGGRRVVANCNKCGAAVCAGHLDQHRCAS
jgi:hypothetical protein